jgi:glutaredoxin 3
MKIQTTAMSCVLVMSLLVDESVSFRPGVVPKGRQHSTTATTTTTQLYLMDFLNAGKKALVKSFAGDYDAAAIRQRLDTLIAENPVLMLSFTTCPYCIKAKQVMADVGCTDYTVVELDQDVDGKAMRAELGEIIGRTSVPAIWINQVFIGGCNDGGPDGGGIVQLQQKGRLVGMLNGAGALK